MTAVPPIAGPGTETPCGVTGYSWCGECGYTGRVAGPRQAKCGQQGWHAWLRKGYDLTHEMLLALPRTRRTD